MSDKPETPAQVDADQLGELIVQVCEELKKDCDD